MESPRQSAFAEPVNHITYLRDESGSGIEVDEWLNGVAGHCRLILLL